MDKISTLFTTAEGRKWVYGVAGAIIALLVGYGALSAELAPLWLSLVGALVWVIGNITAIKNTDSVGRAAVYGLAIAVVALLVGYRVLEQEQAQLWTLLAAVVFGVGTQGLAAINVTPDEPADDDYEESLSDPGIEELDGEDA